MNYIGSKKKLIPFLCEKITKNTKLNSEIPIFCDLFAGTGVVGKEFKKMGYYVISNDIQYYSYITNKHYISNNKFCKETVKEVFEFLNSLPLVKGFIYDNYCMYDDVVRNYFTQYNAMKCDTIRQGIENLFKRKEIEYPMYYFLIASLLKAIDNRANTTSTYSAYLKNFKPRAKKNIDFKPLEIIKGLVDHIITDPPYSISKENNFSTMKNSKRKGIDFGKWDKNFDLTGWINKYAKLVKKNGSIIIFCSYRYISFIIETLENNDFEVKDFIEWKKSNPMPRNVNRRYVQDTEFAIWGVKKNAKWTFNKPKEIPYLRSSFTTSVVSGNERTIHPTQKSLELMRQLIKIHTNENEIILDMFLGSGTTGVATLLENRKFIGIELSKEYFDIAKARIENIKKDTIF